MVHVFSMLVLMIHSLAAMCVCVRSLDGRIVHVRVVGIVVRMLMLVRNGPVLVLMAVPLGRVKVDAERHQEGRSRELQTSRFATDRPRHDTAAPTNGAIAKTDAVRPAPIFRCARRE